MPANQQSAIVPIGPKQKILAVSGGVGGAKLAHGLAAILSSEQLSIVVNTADDFEHLGLSISPDLDTIMYTLAGLNDSQRGWGLCDESWQAMSALEQLGGENWFRLGDKDLATHLLRSQALARGQSLSEVTANLCNQLGIAHTVLPMSDDPVRTIVETDQGNMAFQHYFVREQCAPAVRSIHFEGVTNARPHADLLELLQSADLAATIICPSNPFVSVSPLLQLPGLHQAMIDSSAPVIAVSPIVAGMAIKGPTAKMMRELDMPVTATAVADYYGDLLDGFVIDESDRDHAEIIRSLGVAVLVVPTIMKTEQDRIDLAEQVLNFSNQFSDRSTENSNGSDN